MIQAKLKIEIMAGYLVLVSCFAFIIFFVHEERGKKSAMEQQEAHWQEERQQTNRAFLCLLDLASTGELIAGWTEDDYAAYRKKQAATVTLLQNLKAGQEDSLQRTCIDSICSLLAEKEKQMAALLQLLENMPDAGEIVHRKIPAAVSQSKKDVSGQKVAVVPAGEEKKKSFWGIFRKQEKKSAYARQREETQKEPVPAATSGTRTAGVKPSALLHSIEKEIDNATRHYEETLSVKMDSLRLHNRRLNDRINLLVQNFEEKERESFCREIRWQQETRTRTFRLIAGIGIGAFLLVILLYIVIHRDVNRQYRYRRRLETSNKENIELLAARKNMMLSIAHDLRAPLATIKGCAELLPGEEEKSHKDEYAENILHSSDYMVGLVNTLIEFYLLDTGRNKPSLSIFRLETLFNEIAQNYGSLAEKRKLRLTTDFSGMDAVVSGDRSRLQQILNNLLSNAIKFTRQGEVRLQAEYRNKELHFSVQDTGTGMTEEEIGRIFAAFERLDNARNLPGFGLGLAIASRLVSGMQGSLTVKSKPGEGSTFAVFLPFPEADESTRMDETRIAADYHLDEIQVLVIDDDRIQLNVTKEMFYRNRVRCDCCQTSRELVTRLRSQEYDLLLTDIQMPETDGYGILELLRTSNMENAKTIPVIAVTARVDDDNEYLSGGFSGCIHKPFSMEELINAVAQVIGEKDKKEYEPDFSLILSGGRQPGGNARFIYRREPERASCVDRCLRPAGPGSPDLNTA
ncbi:MAG: hybrid sensor histidine kinase/response regulator [Parabacteroides gordonii]|nr:hybrid sensor histidine kinase/response regulator [Parabacteroides gordonii]